MKRLISRWSWGLVALLPLFVNAAPSTAAEGMPELDIHQLSQQLLRDPVEFLVDRHREPLEQLDLQRFQPLTGSDINRGIASETYWLRVRLRNTGDQAVSWLIFHETSYLDNLVIYTRNQGSDHFERTALSDRQPFHTRPVDYRRLAFPHTTAAHAYTDIYLQVYYDKADSLTLNFHLMEEGQFHRAVREENLFYGGYYGILLMLSLIALIFSMLLRQTSAVIYGCFLLCTAVKWSLLNGFGFQYLWPNSVFWHNEGFHILYLLFAILGLQFSKTFLKTGRFFPGTHKLFIALQAAAIIGILLRFAGLYEPILHFSFAMLAILAVVIPIISWRAWRSGVDYARWYLFAWLVYSFSLLIALTSAYSDWLNWGMQSLTYLQVGSILEAVFLTIAMTERLISLDKDRRKAIALAHQDPLTGLGNRRLLQMKYEAFRDQFAIDRLPVFLIMIDLDHFKRVNDQYGHEAGDYILKEVAQLLRDLSRNNDVCVRYGGEEFAILLHADSITTAHQIGERIRKRFAEKPTEYQGHKIRHTLSMGITPVLSEQEMLSVNEMMARADAALYEGKASGRNCTIIHSEARLSDENP